MNHRVSLYPILFIDILLGLKPQTTGGVRRIAAILDSVAMNSNWDDASLTRLISRMKHMIDDAAPCVLATFERFLKNVGNNYRKQTQPTYLPFPSLTLCRSFSLCSQVYKLKLLIYRHLAIQKKLKNLWTSAPCDQRSCVFTRPTDQLALLSAISNLWWRTVGFIMARTQSWRGASEQFVFLILFVEWLP